MMEDKLKQLRFEIEACVRQAYEAGYQDGVVEGRHVALEEIGRHDRASRLSRDAGDLVEQKVTGG